MAFKEAAEGTTTDLSVIERAIALNTRLQEHLQLKAEVVLERWLRDHCVEYRVGAAAEHFSVGWELALTRLIKQAEIFLKVLGDARNAAPAGYDRVRSAFSPAAYEAITHAHAIASLVETEIDVTNAIAEDHDAALAHTVFKDPMPRLVHEPYSAVVAQIATYGPSQAQLEFDRVIAACDDLIQRELTQMRARVHEACAAHRIRLQRYVRNAWTKLHAHAIAHSVELNQLAAVVTATERAYSNQLPPEKRHTNAPM
jgi:hypothetical protein